MARHNVGNLVVQLVVEGGDDVGGGCVCGVWVRVCVCVGVVAIA